MQAVAGQSAWICGIGDVDILSSVQGQWEPGVLHDVSYVPAFHRNLFSTASAAQRDVETLYTKVG